MGKSNRNILSLGIDITGALKDLDVLKSSLLSFENIGVNLPDDIKEQIKQLQEQVNEILNSYQSLSKTKLNAITFSNLQNTITQQVDALEARTSVLEETFLRLINVFSSADASSFSNYVNGVKTKMTELKDITNDTNNAIANLLNNKPANTEIHAIDSKG